MQFLIYSEKITNRLKYTFSQILPAVGLNHYQYTSNKEFFKVSEAAKLNYSAQRITSSEVWVKPVDLLFEKEIIHEKIECFLWGEIKAFFKNSEGDLPFDLFAASFYLISRYEEYLLHNLDAYGRYAHENSLAFKEGFLHLPLVNLWLNKFRQVLQKQFSSLIFENPQFSFLPTYDIDIAWSYLNKGLTRNLAGFLKSMINSEWAAVKERMEVLFGKQKDPFDSYLWLDELHSKYDLHPLYFFLLAKQNKDYDKNILPSNNALQNLVKASNDRYLTGIHPSWQSSDRPGSLKEEIETLKALTGKEVFRSRQHYIRLTLPATYRSLIKMGITEDYSMGYGSINGFRASYCLPFKWYDLQKEETTTLNIFPFCFMDANSFYEQQYTTHQVHMELNHYYKVTREANGLLVTIWHNHFLGTERMFTGWREVYKTFIKGISYS